MSVIMKVWVVAVMDDMPMPSPISKIDPPIHLYLGPKKLCQALLCLLEHVLVSNAAFPPTQIFPPHSYLTPPSYINIYIYIGSVPEEDAGPTHDSDLAIAGHHFSHLKRQLGFMQLTLLGIGGSIGAGVFSLSGVAATKAGPAVIFSFLFAGLIAAIDALCYAEMASRYPQAGTVFLYTHLTFGELPALLLALNLLVDYHVAASLIARSFAIYLVEFLKHCGLAVPVWVSSFHVTQVISLSFIAPLLLLVLTVILCRGTETGAWVNMVLTTIKICVILLVIVMGTIHINPTNWLPFAPMGFGQVVQTSSTVFFSFVGFDTIAASSEECKVCSFVHTHTHTHTQATVRKR